MTLRRALVRSAALGAATGGRTFTGSAALVWTARPAISAPGRAAVTVAALGELVADKLPQTPSRLSAPALGGRMLAALGCGAVVASRDGADRSTAAACALSAAAVAVGAAVTGTRWRAYAQKRGLNALFAAVAEDVVVLSLAAAAIAPVTTG